jgi:phosphoribosylanthranilate isomerase
MMVKICGITNFEDAIVCANCGANAIGFIFYRNSKRYIKPETAGEIISKLPLFLMKVGVFVNEDENYINKAALKIGLNVVQLHGNETPAFIEKINLPVIKSFRIDDDFDFSILNEYKECSFLFDSYNPDEFGGTGKQFNWDKIPKELKHKIILAGGISIENIEDVYRTVNPAAVDLSSSLEKIPGKKDHRKIKLFFNKINKLREENADNNGA